MTYSHSLPTDLLIASRIFLYQATETWTPSVCIKADDETEAGLLAIRASMAECVLSAQESDAVVRVLSDARPLDASEFADLPQWPG